VGALATVLGLPGTFPHNPKPSKAPKPNSDVNEANNKATGEGMNESEIEAAIPEYFTQSTHTECR
jgi:hypothetical protein